jgi:iron(III) transport system ATP-binding protein
MKSQIKSNAADVRFEGISKIYGKDALAVSDINLDIKRGSLVTLLGPSGCGKTTTLRMIAGLELPSSGKIFIGGEEVTDLPATERDVAMVFQSYALFPHMTVWENISYGLANSKLKKHEVREKTAAGIELVGLTGFEERLPSELSGGQQQRVAVARAIVLEPQVLLFDEPLSNLDAKLRRQVREEIRDLQIQLGLTVVYVTHDQEEALAVSDEIVVMDKASIAQIGSPLELYNQPNSVFVADFIGEANILECDVIGVDNKHSVVKIDEYEFKVSNTLSTGSVAKLAVRPDKIMLAGTVGIENSLQGTVSKATYVGNHYEYTISGPFGEIFVIEDTSRHKKEKGTDVSLTFMETGPYLVPT